MKTKKIINNNKKYCNNNNKKYTKILEIEK